MRWIVLIGLLASLNGYSQLKSYLLGVKGDTLNIVDNKGLKQGKWINHFDEVRGEAGDEEEGEYKDNRKEGNWRLYNLNGDLIGAEFYRWGNKDGINSYFNGNGALVREESWKALNPEQQYDTFNIEDIDHLNQYKTVIVKNDGVAIKHGTWKFYNSTTGTIYKTETYELGKFEAPKNSPAVSDSTAIAGSKVKPKEVLDFEKKNSGKKKVKYKDGTVY